MTSHPKRTRAHPCSKTRLPPKLPLGRGRVVDGTDSTISPTDLTQDALRARVRIHPRPDAGSTRACDANGYGRVFLTGKERRLQESTSEVFVGPLPAGARLKHTLRR